MSKHTPGPWIHAPGVMGGEFAIWCKHNGLRIAIIGFPESTVWERYPYPETVANARLIAAAPKLYEAARTALSLMPMGPEKDALIEALLTAKGKE